MTVRRPEMSTCTWREHAGTPYVYLRYSADPVESAPLTREVAATLLAEPAGSVVRVLVDLTQISLGGWPKDAMAEGRNLTRRVRDHCTVRMAVVGVRGPMAAIIRATSFVIGNPVVPCPDEASAVAYLTRG
jgi:hypothetical protein